MDRKACKSVTNECVIVILITRVIILKADLGA